MTEFRYRTPQGRRRVVQARTIYDHPPGNPQPTPCRLWQGAVDRDGYGVINKHDREVNRFRKLRVHRWVWEAVNGPIPAKLREQIVIRHLCDNPPCFRLSHLEPGTVADNVADAAGRGHLGPAPKLPPSGICNVIRRRERGESYRSIHADYPEVSLATIKRIGYVGRRGFADVFWEETFG